MSEQMADQPGTETASVNIEPAVPAASDAPREPAAASLGQGTELESPQVSKPAESGDAPKPDAPKAEAARTPGKIMIMSPGDRAWDGKATGPEVNAEPGSGMFGKRRLGALAAVAVLAAATGALGGALATAGLGHFLGENTASAGNPTLEAAIARIDADIANLKVSVEHTSKVGMTQFNKTSDRLDKVEKAQAEPAAKLAKLGEAVDKLRAAPVAATAAAAKEVTGSIAPAATTPAAAPKASDVARSEAGKAEVARLPTVDGWVLRDVANGSALIEGRRGMFEVYAGDPVPGLGRVDAIRRQDGRWVVVTSKGLIVAH